MLNWWARRRTFKKLAREQGLTSQQAAAVKRSLDEGHEAAVQQMAAIQEQQRGALLAAGIDVSKIKPLVGREIPWLDIVRHVFRVLEFDRSDTTIVNDKVVDAGPGKPYGYLLVESPILNQPITLPIIHRDDFWLAASVFDDPQFVRLINDAELLVTYAPKKVLPNGFSGDPSHCLHYVLTPRGTLARYYEVEGDLHMREPAPEKLLGSFVYEGEVRVGVNKTPAI